MIDLPRRSFLGAAPLFAAAPWMSGTHARADDDEAADVYDAFPSTDQSLVRDIVGAAHARVDRVRELVEMHPALARGSYDWGFGDWESALGAASHMGRRDIAAVLIDHGARPNLFTAAMMGQLDVVKATIEANPGIQRIPGPHGITLYGHARNGHRASSDAGTRDVMEYLESLGDADQQPETQPLTEAEQERYLGTYPYGSGSTEILRVKRMRNGGLGLEREGAIGRRLMYLGDDAFYPSGATAVRIRFDVREGRAVSLTVVDHGPVLTARRG